jgi:four helix bundle protein
MPSPSEDQHQILWERRQAELWERLFQVTQDVIALAETMENGAGTAVVKQEMIKSAVSIGKELVRATAADDRRDFAEAVHEAKLKAVETDYWLRLIYMLQQREHVQHDLSSIISQYAAIIDLLQKMVRHARDERDIVSRHVKGPKVVL